MKLYKFLSRTRVALTSDPSGANLPAPGPWAYRNSVNVTEKEKPRIGAGSAEILLEIEHNGYIVVPDATAAAKKKSTKKAAKKK